jgi:hypothetical protein
MLPDEPASTHAMKAQFLEAQRVVSESMNRYHRNQVSKRNESNINMKIDNMDDVDRAIHAAISNECNSKMEIDEIADRNIRAALNNVSNSYEDPIDKAQHPTNTLPATPSSNLLPHEKAAKLWCRAEKLAGTRKVSYSIKKSINEESSKRAIEKEKHRSNKNYLRRKSKMKEKEQEEMEQKSNELNELKRKMVTIVQQNARQFLINERRNDIKPYCSTLQSRWNHECRWGCGYIHLDRATKHMKSNCCQNGLLSPLEGGYFFKRYGDLKPMSAEMQDLMVNNIEHMGPLSSTYGNVLSLAAIGVENGHKATGVKNTHPGGFENRGNGAPSCVTMNGRTFHYLTIASDLADGIGKYCSIYLCSYNLTKLYFIIDLRWLRILGLRS